MRADINVARLGPEHRLRRGCPLDALEHQKGLVIVVRVQGVEVDGRGLVAVDVEHVGPLVGPRAHGRRRFTFGQYNDVDAAVDKLVAGLPVDDEPVLCPVLAEDVHPVAVGGIQKVGDGAQAFAVAAF